MTNTEKFNDEIKNKLFKNKRGNFVHVKLIEKHVYKRGERKFDMCEAETAKGAINKKSGQWMFTNDIKRAIRRGNLYMM